MNIKSKNAINNAVFLPGYEIPIDEKTDKKMTKIQIIEEAYKPFHKGFGSINKSDTRKLWGQEEPYTNGENKNLIQTLIDLFGNETTDENLPGKATELYTTIKRGNFSWVEKRLERVYQKIIENDPDIICLQEYGNCKNLTNINQNINQNGGTTFASSENYKNHFPPPGSLASKLMALGYFYKLFSYNPDDSNGDDGVAIFFKNTTFTNADNIYLDMDKDNQANYTYYTTQRGCGLLELPIIDTQQKVIICTTHIQTPSNEKDKDPKNYEIRRGELTYIKKYINDKYKNPNDKVIFCGDFNLDLNKPADKAVVDDFEKDNILRRIKYNGDNDDIGLVTSYPSGRKEYIDYFFTNCGGKVSGDYKSKNELTDNITIPNGDTQPSDHIPILLTIDLSSKGGKSRKRRRKTQRKKQRKTRRKGQRKSRR